MKHEEYIFKGTLDTMLYGVIYIAIPVTQIFLGFGKDNMMNTYLCSFISMIGLLYDSHTRYTKGMEKIAKKKILVIGIIAFFLTLLSFMGMMIEIDGSKVPNIVNAIYAIFAFTIVIWIHDGYYIVNLDLNLL